MYFSDIYVDRDLPQEMRNHEVLWGKLTEKNIIRGSNLLFSCSFRQNFCQIIGLCPTSDVWRGPSPTRLENSGYATVYISNSYYGSSLLTTTMNDDE